MSHDFQSCDMNQYLSKSLQFDIFFFYQMAEMLEHMSEYLYDFTKFIFASIRCTIPNFQTCEQFCCSLYLLSCPLTTPEEVLLQFSLLKGYVPHVDTLPNQEHTNT